jgi:hypothetical protein
MTRVACAVASASSPDSSGSSVSAKRTRFQRAMPGWLPNA